MLLAGVANVRRSTFLIAVAIGRGFRYGSEGQNVYLRLDFVEGAELVPGESELRVSVQAAHSSDPPSVRVVPLNGSVDGVESVCGRVCEVRISLSSFSIPFGHDLRFQLSLWQGGLPMEALPPQGWIELSTAEPMDMLI